MLTQRLTALQIMGFTSHWQYADWRAIWRTTKPVLFGQDYLRDAKQVLVQASSFADAQRIAERLTVAPSSSAVVAISDSAQFYRATWEERRPC